MFITVLRMETVQAWKDPGIWNQKIEIQILAHPWSSLCVCVVVFK